MFKITERQYNIIMEQAQRCYPQETGGILGGQEETILGVLPIANKVSEKQNEVFGITTDDLDRAYHFLVKHNLHYLGIYHTHPKGLPIPSKQDLSHNQKYLFIIGLKDRYNPELYVWRHEGDKIYREDIKIISDMGVTVVDIMTGQPKLSANASREHIDRLAQMIDEMKAGRRPEYPKYDANGWGPSSFNTFA